MQYAKKSPLFYGWYITLVAFLANFMSVGTGFYVFNAFMQPMCNAYGWSRTEISLALAAGSMVGIGGQLLYGTLVLRLGVRRLMIFGSLLAGVVFMNLGRAHELWHFYLLYMVLLLGNGAYGGIVANTAVNNWFVRKRGAAIGLATAGISLSGAILPFVALLLIERGGMGAAFFWLGAVVMGIAPLAWLVMRDGPEECGLRPDGNEEDLERVPVDRRLRPPVTRGVPAAYTIGLWTPAKIWRLASFWKIGCAYALVMIGVVGVLSQLKPRFTDIGFDDHAAMAMLTITAFLGAVGKYVWGMLCDRFDSRSVVATLMALGGVSLIFSLFEQSVPLLLLFVVVFGFAMGGVLSTFPIVIASFFGRESFASVARILALFFLFQMLGYPIAGASFDLTGSYKSAYLLFIVFNVVAATLILSVKRPELVTA